MGIPSNQLPDSFRRCMAPEVRRATCLPTLQESQDKAAAGEEIKLHNQFIQWCQLCQVPYLYCNPTRKSTIALGHPDFTLLWQGKACCIEFKTVAGKLSDDQQTRLAALEKAGVPCLVAYNLGAAITFTCAALNLTP